ncbi:DUF6308 family protein [Streptomyces goshikiensis]|uniref:DUF6308 family protein n=1 Tax=Streptomyces goshikiensis TaxID=1942 RepID=UPI00371BBBA8
MAFAGSRFEHLAGGGDRPEVADRITAEDLVAVQTLSVTVPGSVALDILEGPLGVRLPGRLYGIARHIDMVDAEAASWPTARRRTGPGVSCATSLTGPRRWGESQSPVVHSGLQVRYLSISLAAAVPRPFAAHATKEL